MSWPWVVAIVLGSLAYTAAALSLSRHVVGRWRYEDWKVKKERPYASAGETPEEHRLSEEGLSALGAACLCLLLLPAMACYVLVDSRQGWAVLPREYRQAQGARQQAERIEELERLLRDGAA